MRIYIYNYNIHTYVYISIHIGRLLRSLHMTVIKVLKSTNKLPTNLAHALMKFFAQHSYLHCAFVSLTRWLDKSTLKKESTMKEKKPALTTTKLMNQGFRWSFSFLSSNNTIGPFLSFTSR